MPNITKKLTYRSTHLLLLLPLATLLCAGVVAYALVGPGDVEAHSCGHVQFHRNHTGVTADHASTLTFATDHGHNHKERAVSYSWYKGTGNSTTSGSGLPPAGAEGWHLHCLIIGGL